MRQASSHTRGGAAARARATAQRRSKAGEWAARCGGASVGARRALGSSGCMQQYAVAGGGRRQQALVQGAWGSGICGRTERRGRPVVMAAGREKLGERASFKTN